MRRLAALVLTQFLLWTLLSQANHALTDLHVYLFAGALYVAYGALYQPWRTGLAATFIGGLICDATTPVWFGTHALLFAAAHTVIYHMRDRIPREDNIALILVALLTNLALFLLFSFTQVHASPSAAAAWPRLFADLVCSQIVVTAMTPWFVALQARTLALFGLRREILA